MITVELRDVYHRARADFWRPARRILNGVSLSVEEGEIYGFLGPNGAGKTTTFRCITGLLTPTSGRVVVLGGTMKDPGVRGRVGFMPEGGAYGGNLTGQDLLHYHAILSGLSAVEARRVTAELVEQFGLKNHSASRIANYSKGLVQRLGLALALISDPDLLLLDEPMSGLDPVGRRMVLDLMMVLRSKGKTIIFSTHILSDIETVCDRVGVLVEGRLCWEGHLQELYEDQVGTMEITVKTLSSEINDRFESLFDRSDTLAQGRQRLFVRDVKAGNNLLVELLEHGVTVFDVQTGRGALENLLTNKLVETKSGFDHRHH